jgi:hypothetical protein
VSREVLCGQGKNRCQMINVPSVIYRLEMLRQGTPVYSKPMVGLTQNPKLLNPTDNQGAVLATQAPERELGEP